MTANPRSWMEQGVGGRHSTEVPEETTELHGKGKGGHFDRFSMDCGLDKVRLAIRPRNALRPLRGWLESTAKKTETARFCPVWATVVEEPDVGKPQVRFDESSPGVTGRVGIGGPLKRTFWWNSATAIILSGGRGSEEPLLYLYYHSGAGSKPKRYSPNE